MYLRIYFLYPSHFTFMLRMYSESINKYFVWLVIWIIGSLVSSGSVQENKKNTPFLKVFSHASSRNQYLPLIKADLISQQWDTEQWTIIIISKLKQSTIPRIFEPSSSIRNNGRSGNVDKPTRTTTERAQSPTPQFCVVLFLPAAPLSFEFR